MMNTKFQIFSEAKTPMHEYKLQSNYTRKTTQKNKHHRFQVIICCTKTSQKMNYTCSTIVTKSQC